MPHPKQHITDLAEICRKKGITKVIISPGSRSAPLIHAFVRVFGNSCISIVDERSAAYFALGVASYMQKPALLLSTSGTAVLNYAPALAEAYYQKVPLLALTADRPREWIDQQDNQTLRQSGIFRNFIKEYYDLPQVISSEDDLWYAHRVINEAINTCSSPDSGPVHINIPLTEPLYDELPRHSENLRIIGRAAPRITLSLTEDLLQEWNAAKRIMIIHGQDIPGSEVSKILPLLAGDQRIVVMAENISNVQGEAFISNSNLILSKSRGHSPDFPDLVIHSGGQVVSKALTGYLRRAGPLRCWRLGTERQLIDTFKQVTCNIPYEPHVVYQALAQLPKPPADQVYKESWLNIAARADAEADKTIQHAPFSDLLVFKDLSESIPDGSVVVLGNSSVIRYTQLFPANPALYYYANRGVSGIDGCLSTASGIAHSSGKPTFALVGDLGFVYDSNALWNRELSPNLKIVVINNRGGGIFHILKGPSEHPGFKKFVEANHPVNIHKFAEAFGLDHYVAGTQSEFDSAWRKFIKVAAKAALLEVQTDAAVSASLFRQMMGS